MGTSSWPTGATAGSRWAPPSSVLVPGRAPPPSDRLRPRLTGSSCLLQVFDGSGSFLSYVNTAADPLYGPQGLALTSDGHVVVADSGNHCFKVYRYLQ